MSRQPDPAYGMGLIVLAVMLGPAICGLVVIAASVLNLLGLW